MPVIKLTAASDKRVHVYRPQDWGSAFATDFWMYCHDGDLVAGGGDDLVNHGWISSGGVYLPNTGADFMSGSPAADIGTIGGYHMDTASDTLCSPYIFGDYMHQLMFQELMGYTPSVLTAEFYGRLSANADENGSGFGFWENGATSGFAVGDTMAVISSGGTVFELHSGAAEDAGSTDNTDLHLWKIKCTGTTAEWFIDGTSQGTIALQDNLWPVGFGLNTQAAGTNDPILCWAHVWYD